MTRVFFKKLLTINKILIHFTTMKAHNKSIITLTYEALSSIREEQGNEYVRLKNNLTYLIDFMYTKQSPESYLHDVMQKLSLYWTGEMEEKHNELKLLRMKSFNTI